jgi:hypothetical protein
MLVPVDFSCTVVSYGLCKSFCCVSRHHSDYLDPYTTWSYIIQDSISSYGFMKHRVITLSDLYRLSLPVSIRFLLAILLDLISFGTQTRLTFGQTRFVARVEVLIKLQTLRPLFSVVRLWWWLLLCTLFCNVTQIKIFRVEIWWKWRPQFLIIVTKNTL